MYQLRLRATLAIALSILSVMSFAPFLSSFVVPVQATSSSFSFASAGDAAAVTSGDGYNSLNRLATSGVDFFLGVGDYSYDSSVNGDAWCNSFKTKFNNIEIGPGNHDTGESSIGDTSATRSYEKYLAGCPFTLSSAMTCGPVSGNCYGKEYYFDYPSTNPLARFIMISPRIFNITGVCATNCNTATGTPCTDQYGCWQYNTNDAHYTWTANAIDNARSLGIRWVFVASHKTCISAGVESCTIGTALFNMLVSKRVDLILEGHDHSYQRGKQFGFSSSCAAFTTTNSFVNYNPNCIVNNGSTGVYSPGAGTVLVVEGTFGDGYTTVNDTTVNGGANAAESAYFVKLMGSNTPGNGHGFLKYTIASDRVDIASNFAGSVSDSFSIAGTPPALSTGFTFAPNPIPTGSLGTFTAAAMGGIQPYGFSWNFGDGGTAMGNAPTHTYATEGNYNVTLTSNDSSGLTAKSSKIVAVRTRVFTFGASGDFQSLTSATGINNLNMLQSANPDFFLGLGDFSYDPSITGDAWCSQFKAADNGIQILPGDHDTGGHNSATFGETHSYEKYVNNCPPTLNVPITCGPVAGNCYGKEYYFDYPAVSPVARIIFASSKIYNITGVCTSSPNCSSQTGQPCTDQYGCWQYNTNDAHYNWVASAIDDARNKGVKWVIVSIHKDCISASDATCSMGLGLFNMLVSKKVDLIIQSHDNAYERSKQIALNTTTCSSLNTDGNGYVVYNSGCITDAGSRGYYTAGAGTVVVVQGAWVNDLYKVNDTSVNGGANAKEAPYFVKLMGLNTPGAGLGFVKYAVYADGIDVQTNFSSSFQDSFSILSTTSPRTTSTTVTCPATGTVGVALTCSAVAADTSPGTASIPTGSVTFTPGGTCVLVSGSCSVSITPSASGTFSVSAAYGGDSTHTTSSGSASITVTSRMTSTTISCPASGDIGVAGTCTATVTDTSPGTATTPTGTVSWSHTNSGSFSSSTCTLASGSCSVTYTPGLSGSHMITGSYGADATHSASSGSSTVAVAVDATTTSIWCTQSYSAISQATTCIATVTDTSPTLSTAPTGTVTFTSSGTGGFTGSPCTLANSTATSATCSVTYNPTAVAGTHTITGTYSADPTHSSSSGTFALTVNLRSTTTMVSCPPRGTVGMPMTCAATVTDTSPGTASAPAGTVTFNPGGTCLLGSPSANSASCSVTITPTAAGSLNVSAGYGGDSSHSTSSGGATVTVSMRATSTIISCSANPTNNNTLTICNATVTDTDFGTAITPTGTVNFASNSTGSFASASCILAATGTVGAANCSVTYTPNVTGHHGITGTYAGDSIHIGSNGITTVTVILQPPQPAYAVVVSAEGKVFRYQNGTLTLIGQPVTTALRQVAWKTDGSYALIVGDSSVLLKYDGVQLTTIPTGITTGYNFWTVSWKPDGSYALIGGSAGLLLKYDGASVSTIKNTFSTTILSIGWHPSGGYALMVGKSGLLLTYDGTTIRSIPTGTTNDLDIAAWNPNGQYALIGGLNGVLLKYNGTLIVPINTGGLVGSQAIRFISWNQAGNLALLVGDSGLVLTYDGSSLALLPAITGSWLYSVSWAGSTAYVVGGNGTVLSYSTGVLKKLPSNTTSSLRGIAWKPA